MQHWLGNWQLDRFVFRALKQQPNVGCRVVAAHTQFLLHTENLLKDGMLSEVDVYISLRRLVIRGRVEVYADTLTGGIRYRPSAYSRK